MPAANNAETNFYRSRLVFIYVNSSKNEQFKKNLDGKFSCRPKRVQKSWKYKCGIFYYN